MPGIEREPLVRRPEATAVGHAANAPDGEGEGRPAVGRVGFIGEELDPAQTLGAPIAAEEGNRKDQPAMGSGSGGGSVPVPPGPPGPINLYRSSGDLSGDTPGNTPGNTPSVTPGSVTPEAVMRDRFRSDYLKLLDGRLAAIRGHVGTKHFEEARIAMLSLEAASGMLGADDLVARLRELRGIVDVAPAPQRLALLSMIEAESASVRQRLEAGETPEASGSVL